MHFIKDVLISLLQYFLFSLAMGQVGLSCAVLADKDKTFFDPQFTNGNFLDELPQCRSVRCLVDLPPFPSF